MIDREELLRLYAGGEKDFTGQKFRGSRWVDQDPKGGIGIFRETNFTRSFFDGSGFRNADLSFANFTMVRIYETFFAENCYMEGVNFSYAVFGQVTFYDVNLTKAIFKNTTFEEAGFENANLSYANLSGATKLVSGRCKNVIFHETIMPNGSVYTGRA